jgi:signal transduction histidine kinase
MSRPASLRATSTTFTLVVTLLALGVSGALVALTTALHRTTVSIGASVESVRVAEEAEVGLLLHERAVDELVRHDIEGEIVRRVGQARSYVSTEQEAGIVADVEAALGAYLAAASDPTRPPAERSALRQRAYQGLEALVRINVDQAREAEASAARWNRLGDVLGYGVGAVFLLGSGALVVWLNGRAIRPMRELAEVMDRFGRGDRDARAEPHGAAELREMGRRFNELATAIVQRREVMIAFLGGVAHDLRNPLSALKLTVGLIRPDRPLPPEDVMRRTIDRIGHQISGMDRMIGDFLEMARIEGGRLELRVEEHDARTFVTEVVELFEGISPGRSLVASVPPEPVPIRADRLRIEQVLTNLVSNALKYSEPDSPVEVELTGAPGEVRLRVTDRGIGIRPDDLPRLFEPFRRVGLSKERIPGVGLGLFVVRRIVEAHGGRIEVQSVVGEGSTFRVVLPSEGP